MFYNLFDLKTNWDSMEFLLVNSKPLVSIKEIKRFVENVENQSNISLIFEKRNYIFI